MPQNKTPTNMYCMLIIGFNGYVILQVYVISRSVLHRCDSKYRITMLATPVIERAQACAWQVWEYYMQTGL